MSTLRVDNVRRSARHPPFDNMKSLAKAWAFHDDNASLTKKSFNVSSYAYVGVGKYNINLTASGNGGTSYRPYMSSKYTTVFTTTAYPLSSSQWSQGAYDSTGAVSDACVDHQTTMFFDLA